MSSSSIFCWFASVAMAAIARHNSINDGGGNIATLNGDRINISPDNIQEPNRFPTAKQTEEPNHLRCVTWTTFFKNSNQWTHDVTVSYCDVKKKKIFQLRFDEPGTIDLNRVLSECSERLCVWEGERTLLGYNACIAKKSILFISQSFYTLLIS